MDNKILYNDECYAIQGAVFEVYREKGHGFQEAVFQECLEIELGLQNIPFVAQPELKLEYKGQPLKHTFRPDLICYGEIIVELKALSQINNEHVAQVMNYLKATGYKLGLLVNFGCHPKATVRRIVL